MSETNWSWNFIYKMHNRCRVSHHKYGDMKKLKQNPILFRDDLRNAIQKISTYKKTGNTEHLIDAANYLMFEFKEMKGYFKAIDNDPNSIVIGDTL